MGTLNSKLKNLEWQFIFTSDLTNSSFDSLSVPLHSILLTRFEQPTFGANYLTFEVKPSPEGGLTDGTQAELRFKDRAMFEFVSLLEKARERAIYMKRQLREDEEGLRKPGVVVLEMFITAHSWNLFYSDLYHACRIEHRLYSRWFAS